VATSITCTVDGTSVPEPAGVGRGVVGDASGDGDAPATLVDVEAGPVVDVEDCVWPLPQAAARTAPPNTTATANRILIGTFTTATSPSRFDGSGHSHFVPATPPIFRSNASGSKKVPF